MNFIAFHTCEISCFYYIEKKSTSQSFFTLVKKYFVYICEILLTIVFYCIMMISGGVFMNFSFSEFLKHELGKKVLKASELAEIMNRAPSYITKLKNQNIIPDYKDLRVIAEQFEIGYEFLLFQIGIIDENTLLHINAFSTLKSYLSEIMNINNMTQEKLSVFFQYMNNNIEKLDQELTDEMLLEVTNTLGNTFILPTYKNPYSKDYYPGFKKLPNIKLAVPEKKYDNKQLKNLPVYTDFNNSEENKVITEVAVDLKTLEKKALNIENEFIWYSPSISIKDLYLVEKGQYKNTDKIIYKKKDTIYIGKYNVKSSDNQVNSIVITDILKPSNNEVIEIPEFFLENQIPEDLIIIGRVLSVLKEV